MRSLEASIAAIGKKEWGTSGPYEGTWNMEYK